VFRLPDVGEGIAEVEVVNWHVAPGATVAEDDPLVDVMTDKATVEMTSPVTGQIVSLHGEPGEKATVGAPLVELEVEGAGNKASESKAAGKAPGKPKAETTAPEAVGKAVASEPAKKNGSAGAPVAAAAATHMRAEGEAPLASPAVRGRAHEMGIELQYVPGTGPGGRITAEDLDRHIETRGAGGRALRGGGGYA
jgi:2-oxoisovalerate dehydrogenase E2 component (dihydrolipoyl transacylase)